MASTTFASVTALTKTSPGRFGAEVNERWTIGGKPNGGYLLSLVGRAATETGPHRHVIAASAHYLRSPEPGPVTIAAELLRAGRNASQLIATMLQNDLPCVVALITTSTLDPDAKPYWDAGLPEIGAGRIEDAVLLPPISPTGFEVAMLGEVQIWMERATLGFGRGKPSGAGELRGWLALPEDQEFDATSLLYAIDGFPPATFEVEVTGWVPTLELTAYVRALPAPGPLRIIQRAQLVDAQRVDETCFVWDSTGRLVAQATQLAGIRLG